MQAKSRIWVQLFILLYAVILVAVAFLSVLPNVQEAENAKAQTVQVQQENSLHSQRLSKLEQEFLELDLIQKELVGLQSELPLRPEYAMFVGSVGEKARKLDLRVKALSMGEPRWFSSEKILENPVAEDTAIELPFSMTLVGKPNELYIFVQRLQYDERIVTIENWHVDTNSLSLNLNGVVYVVTNALEEEDHRTSKFFKESPQLFSILDLQSPDKDEDVGESNE